ncbi:MAG: hypothetical protein PPP55_07715 [Halorubrum sp.]
MTELRHFLTSLYDAVSEAEMQALLNGQRRLRRMVESGEFPDDVTLPVYHATDLSVSLDVGLEARQTKRGIQMYVTEPSADDQTELGFDLEVYDFLQPGDLVSPEDVQKRPGGGLDVHIPLREPPVDPEDAPRFSKRESDPSGERTKSQSEQPADERTNDDHEEATTTNDDPNEDPTAGDESPADDRERTASENEERSEQRTIDQRRSHPKFPGFTLPRDWARDRGSRDTEDDDR